MNTANLVLIDASDLDRVLNNQRLRVALVVLGVSTVALVVVIGVGFWLLRSAKRALRLVSLDAVAGQPSEHHVARSLPSSLHTAAAAFGLDVRPLQDSGVQKLSSLLQIQPVGLSTLWATSDACRRAHYLMEVAKRQ